MKHNRNQLAKAINYALGAGMIASLAMTAAPVSAQDEDEEASDLDRVQVTGSRISRLEAEQATPVVTLDREDIEATGYQSVSDVLRNNSFNVFGSIREESGNTAQGQATVNLRGLGSNRTLILLDGRRIPGSPVMDGQSQNLNNVPFAAVERIEILSDGASAVYGSDAIGGVINIILREDYSGVDVNIRETRSDRKGGDERLFSVTGGIAGDKGNITYSLEHSTKDIIFTRDRWWAAASGFNNPEFGSQTPGQSLYSKNILSGQRGQTLPFNDACESAFGAGHHYYTNDTDPWFGLASPEGLCAYDHTRISALTASLENTSLFANANYDINDNVRFFARGLYARTESFGRYAPAAAAPGWNGPALPEETITYEGQEITLTELLPGDNLLLRADMIGPSRDTNQYDYVGDFTVGFDGMHGGFDWEVAYQYQKYNMHEWGRGYLSQLGVNQLANAGWDPRLPTPMQIDQFGEQLGGAASNSDRLTEMEVHQVDFGVGFDGPDVGAAPISFFFGGEARDEEYMDLAMHQLEAGNVLGSSGGSSGGDRSRWALFGESLVTLVDGLEAGVAVRYDDYSDFGDNLSSKFSLRWQAADWAVVRASAGQGFRAPSLDQLFQAGSWSAAFANNIPLCMQELYGLDQRAQLADVQGLPGFNENLAECSGAAWETQNATVFGANPDLDAEDSTQYSVGTVFDFSQVMNQDLTLALDYYYTEIDDAITPVSAQDVMWMYFSGGIPLCSDGSYDGGACYSTTPAVPGSEHQAQPTNFRSFDTSGFDVKLNYGLDMAGAGYLDVNFQTSYVLEYNQRFTPASELQDYTELTVPEYRSNLTLTWSLGDHKLNWHTQFIPGHCETAVLDIDQIDTLQAKCSTSGGEKVERASWAHHNLSYSYNTPFNSTVTLGINNVNDKDPIIDQSMTVDTSLYPIVGRQYMVEYNQRF
ncbi:MULTISPECIES: TonB-dependent siderophore receptor [unclassified Wenzhouxiangella]|uniref:TonB-dependent receptor plug domain-containing protein n=1 Tax=unclassified Wenzhouxiangella TaxID=2613841 RepID=UPI0015F26076|nr:MULTISPECIES: TonB-dependent receptor [unclassified Wenzhouxiangella]